MCPSSLAQYTKLEKDLLKVFDVNKDGKIDEKDYSFATERIVKLMKENGLGSGAGFAAGFKLAFTGKLL